jgi:hypothetical protein
MMPLSSVNLRTSIFSDQMTAIRDRRPITGRLLLFLIILSLTSRVAVKLPKCEQLHWYLFERTGSLRILLSPLLRHLRHLHLGFTTETVTSEPLVLASTKGMARFHRTASPLEIWVLQSSPYGYGDFGMVGKNAGNSIATCTKWRHLTICRLLASWWASGSCLTFYATIARCGTCDFNIFTDVRDLSFLCYRF